MSEQEQVSFMQKLDAWTETTVIDPLSSFDPQDAEWEELILGVKKAIRAKVLESYRNGQAAGPRVFKQPQKGGR